MPFTRTVVTRTRRGHLDPVVTWQRDDRNRTGIWSRPRLPALIFADTAVAPGSVIQYYNGPLAGGGAGHPVQLIYWGNWWANGAGALRRGQIDQWTQNLLASPYFSELAQYGVPHAPEWRGSTVVTRPAPPAAAASRDIMKAVLDLVDDLIDDDVFPDPDDGPRIAFLVLMPDGFTVTPGTVLGAHSNDYDFDGPFDSDRYWAGWCGPRPANPAATMVTLSHELVELLTDPESSGWRWNPLAPPITEICDGTFSTQASGAQVQQSAWVNGSMATSYYSARHNANIIPIDQDYAAQLKARITETSRVVKEQGTFRPGILDKAACSPSTPECCIEERDYVWQSFEIRETARVRIDSRRFVTPVAAWTLGGMVVSGVGDITLNLEVQSFVGRTAVAGTVPVKLHYEVRPGGIDVACAHAGNFSVVVGCSITDGSIVGNLAPNGNIVATPAIEIDFHGAEVLLDDDYLRQKSRCLTAMVKKYDREYLPTAKPGPGDPINRLQELLAQGLPAHVRPSEYQRVQQAVRANRAAQRLLPREQAALFTQALIDESPALQVLAQGPGTGCSAA